MSLAPGEAAMEAWRAIDPKSMITIPVAAQGRVVAVLVLPLTRMFQAEDLRLAEEFAYRAATAIENAAPLSGAAAGDQGTRGCACRRLARPRESTGGNIAGAKLLQRRT